LQVVGEAQDGEEAVEKARQLRPDAILMDISLPKMDGVTATRIICKEHPHIRVIGLSMHVDPGIAQSMKDAGAVAYLSKGEQRETVVEAIWEHAAAPQ
jgi:DNA-binding NarL/FixJ family response regulator